MKGGRSKGPSGLSQGDPLDERQRDRKLIDGSFDPRSVDWKIGVMFPALLFGKSLGQWIKE
jgi:hypothetical protein